MLRRPCKYFSQGACLKGERCNFSHGDNIHGDLRPTCEMRCLHPFRRGEREEHLKECDKNQKHTEEAETSRTLVPPSKQVSSSESSNVKPEDRPLCSLDAAGNCPQKYVPPFRRKEKEEHLKACEKEQKHTEALKRSQEIEAETSISVVAPCKQVSNSETKNVKPEDRPLCSLDAAGNCLHGDLCPTCAISSPPRTKYVPPFRRKEREEHLKACEKKQKHTEALKRSEEIECGVCLDRVLSKTTIYERKFAVMPECDHTFCISCIVDWRKTPTVSGRPSLRGCPLCRKRSSFVVPSYIWYFSKEEKQDIIDNYKAKLRSIDCKNFNFGNGYCRFGFDCIYKHTVKPGSYVWKYNEPPPRRPPRRILPQDEFTDGSDTDSLYEDLIAELDMNDIHDDDDEDEDDALTPGIWIFYSPMLVLLDRVGSRTRTTISNKLIELWMKTVDFGTNEALVYWQML